MRARSLRRLIITSVTAVLLAAVLAAVYVGVRAMQVREEMAAASDAARRASESLAARDITGAADAITTMSAHAAAVDVAGDPVWRLAEAVPWAGANLAAVRVAASGLARLGTDVAEPLLAVSQELTGLDPAGAAAVLEASASRLNIADEVRADVQRDLAGIDRDALISEVARGVDSIDQVLATAEPITSGAAQAAALLPQILGVDGPRTVLVVVQNTAELRTGGGITGTFVQVNADAGRLSIAAIRDSTSFAPVAEPLLPLRAGEQQSLGDGIGRFVQDASMTADFTLTARLASAWWQSATSVTPDVVLSVDPLVMAAVLRATGPVDTAAGPLTADDVVTRLLVDPYRLLSAEEQSARFADAATAVFAALIERADPVALASALGAPISEGRVSVWSARPEEQAVIAGTALAGPLSRQQQAGDGAFAVYFNDSSGGKLTPYLHVGLGVATESCRGNGRQDVVVSVDLGSSMPADAATTLPTSVTGGGIWGAASGDIAPTVTVVAPPGWYVGGVSLDGELVSSVAVMDDGQPAVTRRTDLAPGATRTLSFRFIAPDETPVEPVLLHTPLLVAPDAPAAVEPCATS